MPVAVIIEVPGVPLAQIDAVAGALGVGAPTRLEGQLAYILAIADDTARIITVWESREALDRFIEGRVRPVFGAAAVQPPDPLILDVYRMLL